MKTRNDNSNIASVIANESAKLISSEHKKFSSKIKECEPDQ
jgi:hypothetical protein